MVTISYGRDTIWIDFISSLYDLPLYIDRAVELQGSLEYVLHPKIALPSAPMKSFQVLVLLWKHPAMYTKKLGEKHIRKAGILIHPAGIACRKLKTSPPQAKQREPYDIE